MKVNQTSLLKSGFFVGLFLLFTHYLSSQVIVRGKVIGENSGEGVESATVYVNSTTNGTTTDTLGNFKLTIDYLPVQIVVSHLGYKNKVLDIDSAPQEPVIIALATSSFALQQVQVTDKNQRAKNIQEFRNDFLGMDQFGESATIKNEEVLFFERTYIEKKMGQNFKIEGADGRQVSRTFKRKDTFKASARAPLTVELPELGYTLQVELVAFEKSYAQRLGMSNTSYYLAYFYFQPYSSRKKSKNKKWAKNREKAYFQSSEHFLKSLFEDNLERNGYRILKNNRDSTTGRLSSEPFDLSEHIEYIDDELAMIKGLKDVELSVLYYGKSNGSPVDLTRKKGRMPSQSIMRLLEDACYFRANGTMPGYNIIFGGMIASKKVGAALPAGYIIEE